VPSLLFIVFPIRY